jgi:hypothetical protein
VLTRPVPGLPYCTYGLRVAAGCVLYAPEAQGSLPQGGSSVPAYQPRAPLRSAYRVVHHRRRSASLEGPRA